MNVSPRRTALSVVLFATLLAVTAGAAAPQVGPRLGQLYPRAVVEENLVPLENWHPYADIERRGFWDSLPDPSRQVLIRRGEEALGKVWPLLPATRFLEFARNGNRSRYEDPFFERRDRIKNLAVAECVENKGRFTDELVNGLWAVLEETSWCVPAHIAAQQAGSGLPDETEPTVDLFAAETAALLAWVDYLAGSRLEAVSPLIRPRLRREVKERILDPCLERDSFWWMGWASPGHVNNWNPWVCSNWLTAALALEQDPQRRVEAVWKAMRALDNFFTVYHSDGGCDEGPNYWGRAGAMLFDCLELLRYATSGAVDVYSDPLIRNMGAFIYRAHIGGSYFINFADARAQVTLPADLVFRYGRRVGDRDMAALGAWAAGHSFASGNVHDNLSLGRLLPALADIEELSAAPAYQPLVRDVWLDGIQVMAARSKAGSTEGFYLAAKGGHNAESHNHNDVGNFLVYCDGQPVLVDAGPETYTAKTFSDQRYEIWTMQSAWHNLPTVNGVMQHDGRGFAARQVRYNRNDSSAEFSLDIAGAYPPEAGIKTWKRSLRLERGGVVRLSDSFVLTKRRGELFLSLLTPCTVERTRPGELRLTEPRPQGRPLTVRVLYDSARLSAQVDTVKIEDELLLRAWEGDLYRIRLSAPEGSPLSDTWKLSLSR